MSKPIKLTEEIQEEFLNKVKEELEKMKVYGGALKIEQKLPEIDRKAMVWFTPVAFSKMLSLIMVSDKEVAWLCTAERYGELDDDIYVIDDVLVYPQEVTGATVESADDLYNEWYDSLPVETLLKIKCNCHSHVNMSTSPSGTDDNDVKKVLSNMTGDMFRIFMIWNKRLEYSARIYDLGKNVLFENNDISVNVLEAEIGDFLADVEDKVKDKTYGAKKTTSVTTYTPPSKTEDKKDNKNDKKDDKKSDEKEDEIDDFYDERYYALLAQLEEDLGLVEPEYKRRQPKYSYEYGGYDDYGYYY